MVLELADVAAMGLQAVPGLDDFPLIIQTNATTFITGEAHLYAPEAP
jgi:hypothetical protein